MNSLKSLFFVAILAAAACGVYVTLNRNPEASQLGTDQSTVKVDMGKPFGDSSAAPPSGGSSAASAVPDFPAQPPPMMPSTLAGNTGYGNRSNLDSSGNSGSSLAPTSPYAPPPTTPPLPSGQQSSTSTIALPPPPSTGSTAAPSAPPFQPAEPLLSGAWSADTLGPARSSAAASSGPPPLPADSSVSALPSVASLSSSTSTTPGSTVPIGTTSRPRARPDYDSRVNPANFAEPSGFAGNSTGGSSTDPRPFDLEGLKEKVKNKMKNRQFAEALTLLSLAYDNPDVSPNDEMYIVQILDTLAGEVIYSRNHSLEEPHIVKADETLETIADAHHVPALLLMRINGLRNPQSLAPGTTLKTVPGPFNAQISVRHMEMTLMLGGRYAGRFPVNLGSDPNRLIGMYTVRNKRSTIDTPVSSAEAAQGLGKPWIDLGDQTRSAHLNLQGAADLRLAGQGGGSATVYLSDQDMDDVYGILSIGSSVVIQR